jgi:hypothetical protein
MANEIVVRNSLQIRKAALVYQSQPNGFNDTMVGEARGETPGLVRATPEGAVVDLSLLTLPGYYTIQNLDLTNTVHLGTYDPTTFFFSPMLEVPPQKGHSAKLSKFLFEQLGTGSGTGAVGDALQLMVKSESADCDVVFNAFEA